MSSTRRTKKGPGRRPLSAQRRQFMDLIDRGWSIRGAAREVGVSRTSANSWMHGAKIYRNGEVVGFKKPLERLAVREVSSRYLSQEERLLIADLHLAGHTQLAIARQLGRSPSTICRELQRNSSAGEGHRLEYQPYRAQRLAVARRTRVHPRRLETNAFLGDLVAEKLQRRWSPAQISDWLHATFPDRPEMWLCHESIYQAIYEPNSRWQRPTPLAPFRATPLRTGRTARRAQVRIHRRRPRFEQPMLSIHERGFDPLDRSQPGNWEGDLIIGRGVTSAIGTLVERQTRTLRLVHLAGQDSDTLHRAIVDRMADLPPTLLRSITWDQGTEMARHRSIAADLRINVYFCDSHSPWQRGSNENTNGLLRDYFPKGVDLGRFSPEHLRAVEDEINHRPRAVLGGRCPADLFRLLLTSETSPNCDVG